ncbi:MAG TPA: ABC transporter ATP-binding protein [Anaerolineales bacterium]|nr:ABC transporter ATP-binding protein [Anaerolineales bacterium]HMV96697.1 ABC transporter ATP-binding protein [Anaerolineales bacterium]HMZ42040.1 ABC transporter ATP-binding protein [Anaerolineales bacterium]HNA53521.1 ABC transporter ATP-binding protein [Anaerolineales bacterium]HNB86052.1 ABC transporter ATP-binding protein [Anaerolineales bacterium]
MNETPLVVENLTFKYRVRPELAIENISFELKQGELLLIAGSSGCGKTTLARCINGLVPRSYRGERSGRVLLHGKEVTELKIAEMAQVVGTLLQDPERQIVASNVYNEIAFGPENLGLPHDEIETRIEQALKRLKIEYLRDRETFNLSGGEKQKVALAGLLAMNPSILLLDEPLASLDPASAHDALKIFRSLADEGKTIILVEHRVEDSIEAKPDRLLYMESGRIKYLGGITSLPKEIDHTQVKLPAQWVVQRVKEDKKHADVPPVQKGESGDEPLVVFEDVSFRYDDEYPLILKDVNLTINRGDLIAVLGPNGAGKSTLVKHAIGLLKPTSGRVLVQGEDTRKMSVAQIARVLGFVFQSPTHMLYAPTVQEELEFGPKNLAFDKEAMDKSVTESLNAVNLKGFEEYPPLGLSFGQQKRTTIAAVLAMQSKIMVMDEPTAGQDFANYTRFMDALCSASNNAKSILSANFDSTLFITHDVDLAVTYANRVLLFGDKHVVADGKPEEVLKDIDLLMKYRVRPTSLLHLNLDLFAKTKKFLPAEALAGFVS